MQREEYAFEKLEEAWSEFKNFKISNNDLDELKSEIESLPNFKSREVLESYKDNEIKYNFLNIINKVFSYVDECAFDKKNYNEYSNKRVLSSSPVDFYQTKWVTNLISYKKYKDLDKLIETIKNIIKYINSPENKITAFRNIKLISFCKWLNPSIEIEENYSDLCEKIYKELSKYNIDVKNEKNRGIVYDKIMFEKNLVKLWDKESMYLKLQPYNTKGISREEVDNYLSNNIMVYSDKKLKIKSNYNIFYAFDKKKETMFLGTFTSDATEDINNIYYRKFERLTESISGIENLPKDKLWGNKKSMRSLIVCNDKIEFENYVLNKSFNLDIDELMNISMEEKMI